MDLSTCGTDDFAEELDVVPTKRCDLDDDVGDTCLGFTTAELFG